MIKLRDLIFETLDEKEVMMISRPQGVSALYRGSLRQAGVASIDNVGDGSWWVSRVLISTREVRRQGIGSELLQRAIKEVLKYDPKARIIVEPGGYDMDTQSQTNFYKKNGFVDIPDQKGVLVYGGNQKPPLKEIRQRLVRGTLSNTPTEVTDVLEEIGYSIIDKLKKNPHMEDYVLLTNRLGPNGKGLWELNNRDPNGTSLFFNTSYKNGEWYSHENNTKRTKQITEEEVNQIARNWTK